MWLQVAREKVNITFYSILTAKFGLGVQNEAGQRITEFCQENTLVIANTLFQQYRKRLCTWTSPDGQYWYQIYYILCSQRWRIQSAKIRPGTDLAQIMSSLLQNSPHSNHIVVLLRKTKLDHACPWPEDFQLLFSHSEQLPHPQTP